MYVLLIDILFWEGKYWNQHKKEAFVTLKLSLPHNWRVCSTSWMWTLLNYEFSRIHYFFWMNVSAFTWMQVLVQHWLRREDAPGALPQNAQLRTYCLTCHLDRQLDVFLRHEQQWMVLVDNVKPNLHQVRYLRYCQQLVHDQWLYMMILFLHY